MNPVYKILRPFAMATAIAGGLSYFLIWAGGPLGLKRGMIYGGIILIALVWLAVVMILQWRAAREATKNSAALEKSIEQQAQAQIASSRPGREGEIEHIKENLIAAIAALKSSRAGKGRGGTGALYVLPWYMIIGPPASGKTTLLANSGLNYPYLDPTRNQPRVKGIGGTRNCDWWFSDEAVILDTAGRYVLPVEQDDSQEWLSFLDLLKKHRKKKPINGLIVGVSIQDLLTGTDDNVEFHAQKIRTRIDELIKQLGISFPIYLMFTKCDLIRGFIEFYGELSKTERGAAWGSTFAMDRVAREPAPVLFSTEMDRLVGSLRSARIPRLAAGARPETRPEILFFPLQFAAVRDRLTHFVEVLFRENPYQEKPTFRGFYFTSGTQEGRPIDQVINAMLRGFGLTAGEEGMYVEPSQPKSYFIENVFSKVIFPDRNIAGPSAEGERRRRAIRTKVFAAGAAGLALFTILLFILSGSNRGLLRSAWTLSDKAAASARAGGLDFSLDDLRTLDGLRAKLETMDSRGRAFSKLVWLGTYQGEKAADAGRRLYLSALHATTMAPAAPYLARSLRAYADSTGSAPGFTRYYNWYRTWRTLQDPAGLLKEKDAHSVAAALADYWASIGTSGERNRDEFAKLLERQLIYASRFPRQLAEVVPPDPRRDEGLDVAASAAIRRLWAADGIYPSILEAGASVPEASVATILAEDRGIAGARNVPGALTLAGWSGPVRRYLDGLDEARADWALRDAFDGEPPRLRDELLDRYAREYTAAWDNFLAGIHVRGRGGRLTPEETGAFLERGAVEGSPALSILRAVSENTRFEKDSDPKLLSIEDSYGPLHEFFRAPGKGNAFRFLKGQLSGEKAPYVEYLQKVAAIKDAFAELAGSRNPERSQQVLALVSWVTTVIPSERGRTPQEIARVLKLPASVVAGTAELVVGGEMAGALQDAWGPVAREFQESLASRYPFSSRGGDASLADFEGFFGPNGTFWSYYSQALSGIVSEDGQQILDPRAKLSPAFLNCLRTAYKIRRALFAEGGGLGFGFSVRTEPPPREGDIVLRSIRLDIGGESHVYQMGPERWEPVSWPGPNPDQGASLRLDAGSSVRDIDELRYEGAWGLFRMIDRAQVSRGSEGAELSLLWTIGAGPVDINVKYDVRGLPAANPFQRGLFQFSCPAQVTAGP